ncbi:Hypothetical predicted protein [Olea europaea subsp. europaea]|uniref:Uncharacterized protein n=1 Tax=Olea europaea subsp. europaea TaxID=158383 RepID=A0A8S0PXF6_OLEEU|nr:Hypothetical predicted protein [Olea europaea subsp. europaea]
MSISRSFIVNGTLTSRHMGSDTLSPNSSSNLAMLKFKDQSLFWALQSLQCVKKNTGTQKDNNNQRNFVVYCVDPAVPPPCGPPFNLLNWILGFTVTVVLPFFSRKWGSLLKLKNEVETTVETIEHVADAVEKVAEEVEKVAEDIADDLPKGGKLRNMVDFVEHMAEEIAKDAHQVEVFIDKVYLIHLF